MTAKDTREAGLEGVPLDVYAHVRAALAEGFRLNEVLELQGVKPAVWAREDLAWKQKLSSDPQEFKRFEQELVLAEDWLDREIKPLRDDLTAWVAFLDAYLSQPSRFDFVTGLKMRMSDVGRLQRRWELRMKAAPAVEKKAVELRRKPLLPPEINVAESVLKRSRNAKPLAAVNVPTAVATTAPAETITEIRGVDLNLLAMITAELAASAGDVEATLRRHGFERERDYREVERAFRELFPCAPELERDFRRLLAHNEQRIRASATASASSQELMPLPPPMRPEPAVVPRPRLDRTSMEVFAPLAASLPFDPRSIPSLHETLSAATPTHSDRDALTGTSLSVDIPSSFALPFAAHRAEAPHGTATSSIAETALLVDIPHEFKLPFEDRPAAANFSQPSAEPNKSHSPALGGTSMSLDAEAHRPAMPFVEKAPVRKPHKLGAVSLGLPVQEMVARAQHPAAASQDLPSPEQPKLTLEQHASLCVELALQPEHADRLLVRYGLTVEEKLTLDARYKAKLDATPSLRDAWNTAYLAYYAWVTREGRGR